MSWLRGIVFFGTVIITVLFWENAWYFASLGMGVSGLTLFICLVLLHSRNDRAFQKHRQLLYINETGVRRLEGTWTQIEDVGNEFVDYQHQYSFDLDIFGHYSVFQWINSTNTYFGRHTLKEALLNPVIDTTIIKKNQSAIKELAEKIDWRQNFEAEGRLIPNAQKKPQGLLDWISTAESERFNQVLRYIYLGIPLFSFLIGIYGMLKLKTPALLGLMISLQAIVFLINYGKNKRILDSIDKNRDKIDLYSWLLTACETEDFKTEYLLSMQKILVDSGGHKASQSIKKLGKIADWSAILQNSMLGPILGIGFFWDVHCVLSLRKWKQACCRHIEPWLEILGKVESLSSLANIRFEQPEWAFPRFEEKEAAFAGEQMGHPLIHKNNRICNNLKLDNRRRIMIITGSNMSGKSTMLRTVGINLVLAYAGAPVCASDIHCSLFNLHTSMRQNDNLENHVSTFYAELLRIKNIVSAVGQRRVTLFLIDEIFRGTNSQDRHDAAAIVLDILNRNKSLGLITTHDYALAKLAEKEHTFINGHFEEQYRDQGITFDYRLKSGVSKTTNAMFLLKLVGITGVEKK
ncbi:DNA mismatch repair protein [bacterium]|nr:DNA mismatch repair protein [bacterium]